MNDFNNLYLIFIILGIIILTYNSIKPTKEHFINPIVGPLRAVANMASQLPSILGMLAEAAINFFLNFIDMFIALFEALEWLGNVVPNFIDTMAYIVTIFSDLMILITLWVNPITMIKSIVKLVFFLVKLIFNTLFSIIKTLGGYFGDKFLDGIRGSLWGIPHGPEQHIEHPNKEKGKGHISRTDLGIHGHHHAGIFGDNLGQANTSYDTDGEDGEGNIKDSSDGWASSEATESSSNPFEPFEKKKGHIYDDGTKKLYQPMRCYRGIGANGYINVVAMIICPPLGVFMSYGLKGIIKILICAGLTLLYYFPGLIYGLLITTHLGLGRDIKMTECGGEFAGIVITGCPKRKSKEACNEATIPNKLAKDGNPINACIWDENKDAKYGGVCRNTHIRYDDYVRYKSSTTKFERTASGVSRKRVTQLDNRNLNLGKEHNTEQTNKYRYDMNANRTKESIVYANVRGTGKDATDVKDAIDTRNKFNKERKDIDNSRYSKFDYKRGPNIGEDPKTFNVPDKK